jgi:hypothetical protein
MLGDAFREAYDLIKEHKGIILPFMVGTLVSFVLVLLAVQVTGASEAVKELQTLLEEYDDTQAEATFTDFDPKDKGDLLAAGSYITGKGSYKKGMTPFLKEKGFTWDKFKELLTTQNITLVSIIGVFIFFFTLYCRAATLGMASLAVTGQDTDFGSTLHMANRYWWRYLVMCITVGIIVILPILISVGLSSLAYSIHPIAAIPVGIILGILTLVLVTYLGTKLLFTTPALFSDDEGPFGSLRESWHTVKGQFWMVFVVGLIMSGIASLAKNLLANPAATSGGVVLFGMGAGKIALSIVLMIIFWVLFSIASAFRDLFYFAAFEEAKTRKL